MSELKYDRMLEMLPMMWSPIEHTTPEVGERCVAYDPDHGDMIARWTADGWVNHVTGLPVKPVYMFPIPVSVVMADAYHDEPRHAEAWRQMNADPPSKRRYEAAKAWQEKARAYNRANPVPAAS